MDMKAKDYLANRDAVFRPLMRDGDTDALPCIEIGGVQVYAYVRDGILVVSLDFDTADTSDQSPFALYGFRDKVPVVVTASGENVWTAFPHDALSEDDARILRKYGSTDLQWVIPDWAQ